MARLKLLPALFPPLFLLLLLVRPPPTSAAAKCNKDDRKALLAIKSFWNDPYHLASWIPDRDCCTAWYDVECDPSTGRVTHLSIFADSNLTGTIPPAVGDLPFLTSLDLRKLPNLTGPVIPQLTRLSRLTFLRLDWNGLSGNVPSFLASIPNLDYINLSFNRFTGSIPPELSSLRKLGFLRLDRNRLTGTIPESFGRFPSGFYLFLSHNNLTGPVPKSLGSVVFATLDLTRNQLSGDPSFLFQPRNLSTDLTIDISRNLFEFDLGKARFDPKLVSLDINHNRIYGSIPPQIANLELQFLNVSYNRLCGRIPTGGNMARFDQSSYLHNRCLCGTPLPPCK